MAAAEATEAAPDSSDGGGQACHPLGSSSSSVLGRSAKSMPARSAPAGNDVKTLLQSCKLSSDTATGMLYTVLHISRQRCSSLED